MKWLIFTGIFAALVLTAFNVSAQRYVGSTTCQGCHPFAYQQWLAGPHVNSHKSLTAMQQKDAKCNTCHIAKTSKQRSAVASGPVGIGCESCHGPGQYYHPNYVMKDKELSAAVGLITPTEANCRQCHTEGTPSIREFDFETFWKEIDHGKAARERWEAEQKAAAP